MKFRSLKICIPVFMSLWLLLVCGCAGEEDQAPSQTVDSGPTAEQEMWDSRIIVSKKGYKQAILGFGHMIRYTGQNSSLFDDGVQVDFFDRNGGHTSILTADAGRFDHDTEEVMGEGNVVVVSDSGYVMKTPRLRYDAEIERIMTDTLVMMVSPQLDTLWSVGFESNADLTHRVFYKPRISFNRHLDLDKALKDETEADSTEAR